MVGWLCVCQLVGMLLKLLICIMYTFVVRSNVATFKTLYYV